MNIIDTWSMITLDLQLIIIMVVYTFWWINDVNYNLVGGIYGIILYIRYVVIASTSTVTSKMTPVDVHRNIGEISYANNNTVACVLVDVIILEMNGDILTCLIVYTIT